MQSRHAQLPFTSFDYRDTRQYKTILVCIRLERKEGIPSFCFSGSNTKKGSLRFVHSASIDTHQSEFPSMHRPHNSHKSKIYYPDTRHYKTIFVCIRLEHKEGIPSSRLLVSSRSEDRTQRRDPSVPFAEHLSEPPFAVHKTKRYLHLQ